MNDDFVTKALQQDRYLKAVRLVDRFETEIERELNRVGDEFVRENPDLFPDVPEPQTTVRPQSVTHVAYVRWRCRMTRVPTDGADDRLTLELYLRWIDPDIFGDSNREGALCAASYKINGVQQEDQELVEQLTREGDWDVRFAPDPHDRDPGTFYVPVETAQDVRDGFEALKRHFSEFGSRFGTDPN